MKATQRPHRGARLGPAVFAACKALRQHAMLPRPGPKIPHLLAPHPTVSAVLRVLPVLLPSVTFRGEEKVGLLPAPEHSRPNRPPWLAAPQWSPLVQVL